MRLTTRGRRVLAITLAFVIGSGLWHDYSIRHQSFFSPDGIWLEAPNGSQRFVPIEEVSAALTAYEKARHDKALRTPQASRTHARATLVAYGWGHTQWTCLDRLWSKESNWRADAKSRTPVIQTRNGKAVKLYAGGIPQILNLDPATPVVEQIERGLDYIHTRYGSPCQAWQRWQHRAGKDGIGGWY